MEQMPLYLVFLQSFPETLLLIYIGLALTGTKLPNRKIICIALAGAFSSYFVRYFHMPPAIKYQVEKHNGMVLVSSHPQNGTRFTVCYPRRKGA